jgi:hypothetical protein
MLEMQAITNIDLRFIRAAVVAIAIAGVRLLASALDQLRGQRSASFWRSGVGTLSNINLAGKTTKARGP